MKVFVSIGTHLWRPGTRCLEVSAIPDGQTSSISWTSKSMPQHKWTHARGSDPLNEKDDSRFQNLIEERVQHLTSGLAGFDFFFVERFVDVVRCISYIRCCILNKEPYKTSVIDVCNTPRVLNFHCEEAVRKSYWRFTLFSDIQLPMPGPWHLGSHPVLLETYLERLLGTP
jgi:hypothetical protein